jgi:hypothetical protein
LPHLKKDLYVGVQNATKECSTGVLHG